MRTRTIVRSAAGARPRSRGAFTLIEMLVVIVFMGLMTLMLAPRLSRASRAVNARAAAVDLTARLAMARQSAISRGDESVVHYASNMVWVTVDSNGTQALLRDTLRLDQKYGVFVAASIDTIRYNTRGFARLSASQTYQLTNIDEVQTVCVTAAGLVLPRGCIL